MMTRILVSLLLLLLARPLLAAAPAPYQPLQTAARPSVLAAQSVLLAIARAGDRLVAVGERGHIVYSDDAGASWTQAEVPVSVTLTALTFVNPLRGWAVGHGLVILATEDGGKSWHKQLDGESLKDNWAQLAAEASRAGDSARAERFQRYREEGADKPLLDIAFVDDRVGFASGAYGMLLTTEDGGRSWQSALQRLEAQEDRHIYRIASRGDSVYLAGEMGLLYRSDDAGQQFELLDTPLTASLFDLQILPDQRLLALGLRGTLWLGDAAAGRWQQLKIDTDYSLIGVVADATASGWWLGDAGGGLWQLSLPSEADATLSPVEHANLGFPLAGLLASTTGGVSWVVGAAGVVNAGGKAK